MVRRSNTTAESLEAITSFFTQQLPERPIHYRPHELRRSVDAAEERILHREWATARLAGLAVQGYTDEVEGVLEQICAYRPEVAFGLGVNVLRRIELACKEEQPRAPVYGWLDRLLEGDESGAFTVHDRAWLEGVDVEYADLAFLPEVTKFLEVPPPKKHASLFAPSASKLKAGDPYTKLRHLRGLPDTELNNKTYDKYLMDVVEALHHENRQGEILKLSMRYEARERISQHRFNLYHDIALHAEANRIASSGTTYAIDDAIAFISSITPRTTKGLQLIQAFRIRITPPHRKL